MKDHYPDKILVFKTNVRFKKDRRRIEPVLNTNARILQWNLDLRDCDKVLRIEAEALPVREVIHLLAQVGYRCEELPD
jgi:hypothetical protein